MSPTITATIEFPSLMTEREAAAALGVKPQTLNLWRTTKRYPLPYTKVGRAVRYRASDLLAFLDSRTVDPAAG
jgi:predicted DNA-binding transcriptional regulator AlpA